MGTTLPSAANRVFAGGYLVPCENRGCFYLGNYS